MADLVRALDEALRARYPVAGVKTPATAARGLKARMNQLEGKFSRKGDRKGVAGRRAAEAAGIPLRTWQRWRTGKQAPGPKLLAKLEAAYRQHVITPKLRPKVNKLGAPNRVEVTAVINWNGYKNKTQQRSTTLGGMRSVMVAVIRDWARNGPEAAAATFEAGVAQQHNVPSVKFEGDAVFIDFPEEGRP